MGVLANTGKKESAHIGGLGNAPCECVPGTEPNFRVFPCRENEFAVGIFLHYLLEIESHGQVSSRLVAIVGNQLKVRSTHQGFLFAN